MPARNLIIIAVFGLAGVFCHGRTATSRYAREVARAIDIISARHVEEVDRRKLFEDALNGMTSGLDQYSSFISPEQFQQVEESLDQFGGIGIIVEMGPESKRLTVLSPLIGTPAFEAGLRAGDTILEIDGTTTENMQLKDSVSLMRGKLGEPVELKIQHEGETQPITVSIKRDRIQIESVLGDRRGDDGQWVFRLEENPRVAYIRLVTFGKQTVEELRDVLTKDEPPYDALVLDLRGNAGGLLTSAVGACDMFISEGPIVSTRGRGGEERSRYEASSETVVSDAIPMVVLVNKYSASASEIVAACLQDHSRAIIVGHRTWGKGTVQNIISMEGGRSALKLTTASYWRPSGKNIHRRKDATESDAWGVSPDKGYAVDIADEDLEKVLKWRRFRDIVRTDDVAKPPADVQPIADPQIEAALRFLKTRVPGLQTAPPPGDGLPKKPEATSPIVEKAEQ